MASFKVSIILSFTVVYILIDQISSISYCEIKTCSKDSQTLCKYRYSQYGNSCGDKKFIKSGLSNVQKHEILKAHNYLRALVARGGEKRGYQPPAKDMRLLTWDYELARVAQKWADQCIFGHDQCRNVARFKVGQNLGFQSHSAVFPNNVTEIVQMWYDEVADFDRNLVKNLQIPNAMVLHYTQLVWAKTTKVGCGLTKYKKDDYWYTIHLVCNYGPAGNVIGRPVYET